MARFYGTVQGGRGMASRLGHRTTGLRVTAQTWNQHVRVWLYVGEDGEDRASITLGDYPIFNGPVDQLSKREGRVQWLASRVYDSSLRQEVIHELAERGLRDMFAKEVDNG